MRHVVKGVVPGEDFASFSKGLDVPLPVLKSIMSWRSDEDSIYDYQLSSEQVAGIEKACSMIFPQGLDYYLACY